MGWRRTLIVVLAIALVVLGILLLMNRISGASASVITGLTVLSFVLFGVVLRMLGAEMRDGEIVMKSRELGATFVETMSSLMFACAGITIGIYTLRAVGLIRATFLG